jgi:hypothetical protein
MAGGMAQVLEHLPIKCEALSLQPSTRKKKNQIDYLIYRKNKSISFLYKSSEMNDRPKIEIQSN